MIQIIKGTFGYYNGRKVIPITEADGPQKFDDELEARLVKEGVAKYIGEQDEPAEQPAPDHGDDADEPASTNTAADEAPEYNEDMKLDELKEVAARYGVDASAMRKKADVIAAIEAAKAPTTRSPLRSAPPILSDGLQLQGDGRGRPPAHVSQSRRVR